MKSNDLDNIYSPRRNDINEDNLNFLNEEASQYIDDNQEQDFPHKSNSFGKKQKNFGNFILFKNETTINLTFYDNVMLI